ncbi:aminoacyl-tRNA deacylase [Vibrio sp. UCD-FRSSP16_10]|uniref:Cys-tRNA(Pro) deacylase n=1 Tax=unclassified Vibrio TaxID=2614977 RepID=UPI0007FF6165|nr:MULTISPECIES: Cys-tRNA(Pro) deacylase [unclassified Vibrio]OBT16003.1 aminoacyl-tRNA deacylase [Vibrio sp. UCD-FRSSP16_30]OBT21086.1 aminoacyl-tRNA deacylase [Vibrio sp. UCD-FRSSP16_10]
MTPAVRLLKKNKVPFELHQYKHDPNHNSFGLEAVEATGKPAEQVFKTLLFSLDGSAQGLAVAVIPVNKKLNLKLAAKANKLKKSAMADPILAQKITGYLVGGISPLAQKKSLPTFIDQSAELLTTLCISGGKRGLEIEMSPQHLALQVQGSFTDLAE